MTFVLRERLFTYLANCISRRVSGIGGVAFIVFGKAFSAAKLLRAASVGTGFKKFFTF